MKIGTQLPAQLSDGSKRLDTTPKCAVSDSAVLDQYTSGASSTTTPGYSSMMPIAEPDCHAVSRVSQQAPKYKTLSVVQKWQQVQSKIKSLQPQQVDSMLLIDAAHLACLSGCYVDAIQYANRVQKNASTYIKALEAKALAQFQWEHIETLKHSLKELGGLDPNNHYYQVLSLLIGYRDEYTELDKLLAIELPKLECLAKQGLSEKCYFPTLNYAIFLAIDFHKGPDENKTETKKQEIEKTLDDAIKLASELGEDVDNTLIEAYKKPIRGFLEGQTVFDIYRST